MEGKRSTLSEAFRASHRRPLLLCFLLLLTLNAGWTDTLCYLYLGHVFSSFMTGNFLFIGLALTQRMSGLLVSACIAVLVFLVSTMCGSFILGRVPQRQVWSLWLNTSIRYLLGEWSILLLFAICWQMNGNLEHHEGIHLLLLALAACAMGIQGALIEAINIPGVVVNALTGTVLLLGLRLAQGISKQTEESEKQKKGNGWMLGMLCLTYIISAILVVSLTPFIAIAFVPLLLITLVIVVLLTAVFMQQRVHLGP